MPTLFTKTATWFGLKYVLPNMKPDDRPAINLVIDFKKTLLYQSKSIFLQAERVMVGWPSG